MKRETKEKLDFLFKWLSIILTIIVFIQHFCFIFAEKRVEPDYPPIYDIRYYHWYLGFALISLAMCLYGAFLEDYLWLWSAGTMVFITIFLGITGEASILLLAPFSIVMILIFTTGYMVRYRPRDATPDDDDMI